MDNLKVLITIIIAPILRENVIMVEPYWRRQWEL
jgi:hypothetical protein